jgi:hypothetical protein
MTHARAEATTTVLADGRVLIAGGYDAGGTPVSQYLASAELYDPSTGKFTPTGSMTSTRAAATATLLVDGRVPIMGGEGCRDSARCTFANWGGSSPLKTAEIHDPATGKFTPTGSMSGPHGDFPAVLLPDGRALVLGPYGRLVEAYNPAIGKFTRAGTLQNNYLGPVGAVLLPSGKILVVGNLTAGPVAELVDPGSGLSSSISSSLPSAIANGQVQTVTLLDGGRALLHFFDFDAKANYLVTFDSATGTFTKAGSFQAPGGWRPTTVVRLRDGRVLFCGGAVAGGDSGAPADLAGLYDPIAGFGLLSSRMIQARFSQVAVALQDGTALIAGGIDSSPAFSSAELFRP